MMFDVWYEISIKNPHQTNQRKAYGLRAMGGSECADS